ncbi:FHAD1 protein, partial [Pedionomus torquatus]|nr:FHAD1 protein [Pedionomus torquatus]
KEEQLKTFQEDNELQRQRLQEETEEYKEQSKQHALTIVALEERLLEAKQQQKKLEEEKAVLVEKMEGKKGSAMIFLRKFQEELAAAQRVLLSKETIIAGLTKELGETRARMSDMRGELSEKQKVELEQSLSQLKHQEQELNLLREKLSHMSSLVEKKDRALEAAAEELRYMPSCKLRLWWVRCRMGKSWLIVFQEPVLDLANLGMRCRGLRHEETIQRQKEGLAELRERVKMLEKRQSSAVMKKSLEPLVVLMKDLPEEMVQKTGLKKEAASVLTTELGAGKVPGQVPNGAVDGAVSSDVEDVTYLGEKMYLDIIGALGSLMKVKELSGMQPLRHLPPEEREKAGMQRRKDLELLYNKIRNLKSRLERKEEMVKDDGTSVEQLSDNLNQVSLQRCQEEMAKLEEEAYRLAEEKALLKEALERTQLQLSQEKRLLRAAKLYKV